MANVALVFYTEGKKFQHPQTKENMPFDDIIHHLRSYAQHIENEEKGRIKLGFMELDIRSPLTKKAS